MNAYDVSKWELCKQRMMSFGVTWEVKSKITLKDDKSLMLGSFETVDEVFCFLCGYEYSQTKRVKW